MDTERNQSKPASTGDVITQKELASQLIFQNIEYPQRQSLWERHQNGARIEPGPLTIVQPYIDLGPFIIPSSEGTRRAEQIRRAIRDADVAVNDVWRDESLNEFRKVSQQLTAGAWETVRERTAASRQGRDWSGLRTLVRDHIYTCELMCVLWAANKFIGVRVRWLRSTAFAIASERVSALAAL